MERDTNATKETRTNERKRIQIRSPTIHEKRAGEERKGMDMIKHQSGDGIQRKPNGTPGRINKFLVASL